VVVKGGFLLEVGRNNGLELKAKLVGVRNKSRGFKD